MHCYRVLIRYVEKRIKKQPPLPPTTPSKYGKSARNGRIAAIDSTIYDSNVNGISIHK